MIIGVSITRGQFTADEIDSTNLEENFTTRSYTKLSVLPEYRYDLSENESLTFRTGATLDDTNRDDSEITGVSDITWKRIHASGNSESIYLSYAETSQVAGYGAIGGGTTGGLFSSNPDLDRETSQNLELGEPYQTRRLELRRGGFLSLGRRLWLTGPTRSSDQSARSANASTSKPLASS